MAFVISDRIKETSTTTGTGTLTLAGAVTGFTTFAAVGNGNTCTYAIIAVDANGVPTGEWETGIGTYTSSGTTLSRGVIKSSNSNNLVSFSAGTKHVICTDVAGYTTPLVIATTANRAIQVADQTALSATAGNARGTGAVDLQTKRTNAAQVASGTYTVLCGGQRNKASGISSTVVGGTDNYATGIRTFIGGGFSHSVTGNYSLICGGYDNTVSGNYAAIVGGQSNLASGNYSCICGGRSHKATGAKSTIVGGRDNKAYSTYSFVGGGKSNTAQTNAYATIVGGKSNSVTGKYSFIGGGTSNTVSSSYSVLVGGYANTCSGVYTFIGGGRQNIASNFSVVCGGKYNTASGQRSGIVSGYRNTASARYTFIGASLRAKADKWGQVTHATGMLSSAGDAQASAFVLRIQTTNNTQSELFLDGSSARMTLSNDTTWVFWGYLVARNTGTDSENACWKFDGQISRNTNEASTAVAGVTTTTINLDMGAAAWTITVDADTTYGSLRIRATGENSKTINWVAAVHTVEVTG